MSTTSTMAKRRRPVSADYEALRTYLDERVDELPDIARCSNPGCEQMCSWRTGKGRPARFCGDNCRTEFNRQRAHLLSDIELLNQALSYSGTPTAVTDRYLNALAKARWLLDRYGVS